MADDKRSGPRRERGRGDGHPVRASETRRGFVLVVDDVEDNRDLYATYFEHSGYRTAQASDGEQALALIAREAPDVVIMDLSMPTLDGWEATRLIKSNPRTRHVVVVVVTGNATEANMAAARSAGADDVCTKPCLPRELLAVVERELSSRRR